MTKSGKPSGMPHGRPAASTEGKTVIDMHMKDVPVDIIDKLDDLRKGSKSKTRKDMLVEIVRAYGEEPSQ